MMGTPANKSLLETTGFWHDDFTTATPNDICVAIRTDCADASVAEMIIARLDEALAALAQGAGRVRALAWFAAGRARRKSCRRPIWP